MAHDTCTIYIAGCGVSAWPAVRTREFRGPAAKKSPRRVLVVDDEPLIRWSVAQTLADLGWEVEQAVDAASTLKAITTADAPFDVVVLDLRLPDMDDLSLLATIRQLRPASAVIIMTAFDTPEIVARAVELGARGVLAKPFELSELSRTVLGCTQPAAAS